MQTRKRKRLPQDANIEIKQKDRIQDSISIVSLFYQQPIIERIAFFADKEVTLSRLLRTDRETFSLFDKPLSSQKLLKHVMDADPVSVVKLLQRLQAFYPNISFVTLKTSSKKQNRHEAKLISPLEYAAGVAGDSFMVNTLLSYVPFESLPEALNQLENVRTHGTEYGCYLTHYVSLINSYEAFLKEPENNPRRYQYFLNVCKQQRKLPMYALQRFCDPKEAFYPLTLYSFNQEPERACQTYDGENLLQLFKEEKKIETLIYKGGAKRPRLFEVERAHNEEEKDKNAWIWLHRKSLHALNFQINAVQNHILICKERAGLRVGI